MTRARVYAAAEQERRGSVAQIVKSNGRELGVFEHGKKAANRVVRFV